MPYVVPTNVTSINLRKETPASRPDVFEGTDVWVAEVRAGASLSFLRENQNLRSLRIQDAEQLTGLEQLTQIDTLYLQHFPKVASLQSLATLLQLRKLYLSRNPSWDGTRKGLEVESFSPLAGLRELSDLTILGVSPRDRSLTPLYALARLRYVHVAWIDGRRRVQVRSTSNNRLERTAEVAAQAARQTSPQEVSHVRRVVLLRKLSAMDQSIVPNPALLARVAHCLGQPLARWRPVAGGYTVATRWLVTCADGSSAFVKGATDALTATWLRLEYSVYTHIQAPFLPTWRAWDDDGVHPILVLEDLSGAVWQAPWTMARITQVLDTLEQVAATTPPRTLPSLEARCPMLSGWAHVAQDPTAFLGLRLCSVAWLSHALDTLMAAEAQARLAGDNLVHFDVRSDNLCFMGDRVVLVDWNWACRGYSRVDIAAWLPSLHLEGGPLPEAILPGEPCLAAVISGYFAARAGRPAQNTQETRVRALQFSQLRVALPWAVRALALPALDGEANPSNV